MSPGARAVNLLRRFYIRNLLHFLGGAVAAVANGTNANTFLPAHERPNNQLGVFSILLFQITDLMHSSFIFQQYVCYITLLNMFRAARCSSSGGQIVSPQPLVSSPSANSRTVCSSPPACCTAAYRGRRYQRLWWYNLSSWGWAACCSKHVEERSVTYILLKNKRIVH